MLKLPTIQSYFYRRIPLSSFRQLTTTTKPPTEIVDTKDKQQLQQQQSSENYLQTKIDETEEIKTKFDNLSTRWRDKHEIYYGKERDMTNYPPIAVPDHHPKVRMGFIPDEWFNALYSRTGVTGPYLFLWGGVLFLMQKEIIVVNSEFHQISGFAGAMIVAHKYIGPLLKKIVMRIREKKIWAAGCQIPEYYRDVSQRMVEVAKEDIKQVDVNLDLFRAAKENVALQLELDYRNRVLALHQAVKSRLDYQVDKERAKQRFQRDYVINWIVNSVIKDFTPQLEKATMTQCIADLKRLAQTATRVKV